MENKAKSFKDSQKYCFNLQLNGYKKWRLPTYNELNFLARERVLATQKQRSTIIDIFKYGASNKYWTSTDNQTIGFFGSFSLARIGTAYIRCAKDIK